MPALGTHLIRHINSGSSCIGLYLRGIEIHIMTLWADIVGAQRIHLRNSCHGSHKGASYGTTGAYQIPVLHRFPYQLLGNDIHHGKAVGNNGMQFLLQTILYNLRKLGSIDFMSLVITDLCQRLITVRDHRRTLIRTHRCNSLNHVRNHIGIGDYDLLCLVRSQIGKLL